MSALSLYTISLAFMLPQDNKEHFEMASKLWVPFICEINEHDGTYEDEEQIIDGLKKRIAILRMS